MPETATATAAVVLIGHGSTRNADSRRTVEECAARLRRRGRFGAVHAAFLKEPPYVAEVLETVTVPTVYLVPYFAYRGYMVDTAIPQNLNLDGAVTERTTPHGRQRIVLCEPVGDHPRVAERAGEHLRALIDSARLDPRHTGLVVIGHGTGLDPRSAQATEALADRLAPAVGKVATAFLDQAPAVESWPTLVDRPDVVILPYLMAAGLHGGRDVPARLGIDPVDPRRDATGPFTLRDRRLWLLRPVGDDPAMDGVVLARIRERQAAKG